MQLQMFNTAPCDRCGFPCQVEGPGNPDARLIRRSQSPDGLCVALATTSILQGIETLRDGINKNGVKILLRNDVQEMFASVMEAGNADVKPEEIDWRRVIAQWDLPFPKTRKHGKVKRRESWLLTNGGETV